MGIFEGTIPIERDDHVLRARRTAATARLAMGLLGVAVLLGAPALSPNPGFAACGFGLIAVSAAVQFAGPGSSWLSIEESLSGLAGILIVGLGAERVSVLSILWLVAVASGVLARGGRVHWLGRYIVLGALALPVIRYGSLSGEYAAFCAAAIGLLLTSGRLTRELNHLLMKARLQAQSAETLLLAGDIAARMADLEEAGGTSIAEPVASSRLSPEEAVSAREALARLIAGDGLSMVVQPIVDTTSGTAHAYEGLARFGQPRHGSSPLHWFALAEELGERPALERACLRLGLELLARRPAGTSLSLNLSAPVLLEESTMAMLQAAGDDLPDELGGLIVEITEETLVHGDMQLAAAIEPLRARGARLAVDDMGAGYSGLRQITSVRPGYLKLDRSLITGIDQDGERAALVAALAGYSRQVGSLLVAEGVETREELETVCRLGVPLIQGFYLARPGEPWPEVGMGGEAAEPPTLGEDSEQVAVLAPAA